MFLTYIYYSSLSIFICFIYPRPQRPRPIQLNEHPDKFLHKSVSCTATKPTEKQIVKEISEIESRLSNFEILNDSYKREKEELERLRNIPDSEKSEQNLIRLGKESIKFNNNFCNFFFA